MTMGWHLERTFSCVVMSLVLISLAVSKTHNSYCSDETPKTGEDQRPTLKDSYTAQVTGKWIYSKKFEYVYEYFDGENNTLAHDSTYDGKNYYQIFDMKTDSVIFLSNHKFCTHFQTSVARLNGLNSLEIVWNLGNVWKYKGETTIRGVKVKQWRSCGGIEGWANFTSDYYFTSDNAPFRLDVIGVKNNDDGKPEKLRVIYDYVLFQKRKPPTNVFFPPPGVYCENLTLVATPSMSNSAHFSMEKIDPIKKRSRNVQVSFDKQRQISREEYGNKIIVYDYKRGIQFTILKKTKTCSRKPLTRFADSGQTVDDKGVIHMASLKHFLYDDGNFTYNGIRKVRGIPCQVFTKSSQAAEELGVTVIEMYIHEQQIMHSFKKETVRLPVRIVMKGGGRHDKLIVKRQYEIYDFDTKQDVLQSGESIGLDPCFGQGKSITFEMFFKGQAADSWDWTKGIERNAVKTISDALNITPLRVTVQYASVGEDYTKIRGKLYEREDPYQMFQVVPNMKFAKNLTSNSYANYTHQKNSPDVCSEYCLNSSKRPFKLLGYCTGFQFDRGTKTCTFFNYMVYNRFAHDEKLKFDSSIDFYRWTNFDMKQFEFKYLSRGWSELQRMVAEGLINTTDNIGDILIATSVRKAQIGGFKQFTPDGSPIYKFINVTGDVNANPVEVVTEIMRDACARHCLNSLKYNCEAFVYNWKSMKCMFYDSTNIIKSNNKDRETFLRNYNTYFDVFYGRTVLSGTSDEVYTGVKDENACAQLCLNEDKFYCQSFELCGQACLLGRKHIYHTPSTNVKPDYSCRHFSRSYVQDYTKEKNKKALLGSNVIKIANIGVKQCATLCSTSSDYDCDVFEFCDADSLCRLTTKSVKNSNDLDYQATGNCDLYSRKKDRQRAFSSGFKSSSIIDTGRHSAGSMGGIAVGMILLGIVVIVVGLLVFSKLRSPVGASDGMAIGFQKNNMDDE